MTPRFAPWIDPNGIGGSSVMRRAADGEWIRYADYLALEARVAVLEGEVEMLREEFNGD